MAGRGAGKVLKVLAVGITSGIARPITISTRCCGASGTEPACGARDAVRGFIPVSRTGGILAQDAVNAACGAGWGVRIFARKAGTAGGRAGGKVLAVGI